MIFFIKGAISYFGVLTTFREELLGDRMAEHEETGGETDFKQKNKNMITFGLDWKEIIKSTNTLNVHIK